MTAATVTSIFDMHHPQIEVVQLTASDGETYTSKKFKYVTHAVATGNENVDAHLNAVTTGTTNVVTINYASQTDKKVTLVLFGNL